MSSALIRRVSAVLGVLLLVAAVSVAGESPAAPVTAHTFRAPDGQVYGAILVRPELAPTTGSLTDVVLLVDTSASQAGEARLKALELVNGILGSLVKGDRVQIVAVDVSAQFLTEDFVAPRSAESQSALKKLEQRAPLGTSNLEEGLASASEAMSKQAGRGRAVVYVGDGSHTAGVFSNAQFSALMTQFRSQQIVLHTIGVGRELHDATLERMASETGGRCITGQTEEGWSDKAIATLNESLRVPVLYPESIRLSDSTLQLLPNPAPPLRGDQATLFLTRGTIGSGLALSVDGKVGGKELHREWPVPSAAHSEDFAYLPDLWAQWQRDKTVAAPGDAQRNLAMAQADHSRNVSNLVLLGEIAARRGQLDQAEKFLQQALEHDPGNLEAKTLMRGVANRQKVMALAQVRSDQDQQQPPPPPKPAPSTSDEQPRSRTPEPLADIRHAVDTEIAAIQQLRTQTNAELDEARKLMSREPEKAINLLKSITLLRIDSALDVPESDRANMRRQVESALRQAAREKERVDLDRAQAQKNAAEAAERQKINAVFLMDEERKSNLLDQFWALMKERSYREALAVANETRRRFYGEPLPELMMFMAETTANWYELLELREIRNHRVLLTLLQVDKSHIPFPDEPPIEYPDANWWEEMSKRRKKWARVDLTVPSPAEEKINEKLRDPVTLEFVETPLSDVIDFLKDFTGVNIVLNKPALEEEGVNSDTPVSIHVQGISLRSALKILLGQYQLQYLIKDDVLQITSQLEAGNELVHKVYPVADLVIPVGGGGMMGGMMGGGMMGGMMGGGGGGGMGGGGGGGMGGGGMGGMGGGGGMGGFGFRNVPDDLSDDLIELIKDAIAPDTWDTRGGQGSIQYYRPNPALIIRQTSEIHGNVSDVLGQVRGTAENKRSMGLRNVNP